MKSLFILILFLFSLVSAAQIVDTIKLIPHKSDHYLAECTDSICIILDTTQFQYHISLHFLKTIKTNKNIVIEIYVNNHKYFHFIDKKVKISDMFGLYILEKEFKNGLIIIGNHHYFLTL